MMLTTQYLEEADVLADRVGIIDQGQIVAEGTPEALKAEIGRPTPGGDPGRTEPLRPRRDVLSRFGESRRRARRRGRRAARARGR